MGSSSIESEQALRRLILENRLQARCLLETIRSVVAQTLTTGYTVSEYVTVLDGRLAALARAQQSYLLEHGRGAELKALVAAQLEAQAIDPDCITVSGPQLELSFHVALALSLALHELMVNAVRFGALGTRGGAVELVWTQASASDAVQLRWHEVSAAAVAPPTRTGFGWEWLRTSLPQEIGARVDVHLSGRALDCSIEFHPQGA